MNEKQDWVALYVDELGTRVTICDTYEQAEKLVRESKVKIGVMTTSFYNRFVNNKKGVRQ